MKPRWYWIAIPLALVLIFGGAALLKRPQIGRPLRQVAFDPRSFTQDTETEFTVQMPIREVRRRLMRANLTKTLIEQQSGNILYDRDAGRDFRGPIKDWEFLIYRDIGVRIDNKFYGQMDLDFSQAVWVDKVSIKSIFTLVKAHDALQDYSCGVELIEVPGGATQVKYSVHITITEYAPESYEQYVQEQLNKTAQRSAENFKKAFINACR